MIPKKARVLACAGISAMLLWPATASAQRVRPGPGHGHAVVRGGFYRPYYYRPFVYPYFYSPFYFGFGAFYNSFYGWYPYYDGWPSPYPYPYPGYYYSGNWASARIEVKPRDAQVFLDGYYVGIVDQFDGFFQRLDIPVGEHELTIYMPGFHTLSERTLFRPGQSYHFKENLQPLPPGAPPEPKPQPDPNAGRRYAPPPPPPYGQQPYAPPPYGQDPYQQPPPPPPQGAPRMEPMPQRPPQNRGSEFGTLNLRVQPEDASVTIDGERWDSPQSGSRLSVQLAPGAHHVEVKKDGFKSYSSTVQIRPGEQQTLNISLPPGN